MLAQNPIIAASVLAADFSRLGEEVAAVTDAGADWLHVDVMDNHYVPNLSFGIPVMRALAKTSRLPLDVHLMTERVETLIAPFAAAGAARLTFHPDTTPHVDRVIDAINDAGLKAGVALNPAMPLTLIEYLLDKVDLVLLMTVNPGFGGQTFIESVLPKIECLRRQIDAAGRPVYLQVDGGINVDTARRCRAAGADTLVAGNAIFAGGDYRAAVTALRA